MEKLLSSLLGSDYSLDDTHFCIMNGDKPITNFIPKLRSAMNLHCGNDSTKSYTIDFHFGPEQTETVQVSDKSFEKQTFYPTCAVIKGRKKVITDFIRQQILKIEFQDWYCAFNGWNKIKNECFYLLGNTVCGTCTTSVYITHRSPIVNISSDDAYTNAIYLWKFIQLSEHVPSILLLGTVFGLLGDLLNQVGFSPLVIYLYGESSTFKTSLSSLLTAVHGPNINMVTLASTPAAIRDFASNHKDIPVIIDDLNKSDRKSIMSRNEEIISNHCQSIVDSGKLILRQGRNTHEIAFRNSTIITAEYRLKNISTRNRILELPMEEVSSEELRECQNQEKKQHVMETFAYHFTKFVSQHLEKVLNRLNTDFDDFQNDISIYYSNSAYRINANLRSLYAVAHILEWYLKEEAMLPEKYLRQWSDTLHQSIHTVCSDQIHEIMNTENNFDSTKYIIALYRALFFEDMSDLPESEDDFFKLEKRLNSGQAEEYEEYPIGFFYDNEHHILCMRGEQMLKFVQDEYPNATKHSISKQLAEYSLIQKDREGKYAIKIGCHEKRYYHIHLDDLMRIGEELYNKNKTGGEINV